MRYFHKELTARSIKLTFTLLVFVSLSALGQENRYLNHTLEPQSLSLETSHGNVTLTAFGDSAIEVHYQWPGINQLPSYAIAPTQTASDVNFKQDAHQLEYRNGQLKAIIQKSPFNIQFYRGDKLLVKENKGFYTQGKNRGFDFSLEQNEKLMGGGERVLGMNRRGHRLPLYNKAHYGYSSDAVQMYFGIPAVVSSKKYILLFDNSARGFIDLGKTDANILNFEATGGRTAYVVIAGQNYPDLISNYVSLTGKQPLPPRWAFGNFASRFGYHSEQEVRTTVNKFFEEDIPLDAVILDLYWFGPDIKGHMGNLAWDSEAFPTPGKMISDFKKQGVNTILITEPFILSSSKRWQEAVNNKALALNKQGQPQRFDFYFGNTGLVDVFDKRAGDWFWGIYQQLMEQGVEGWWGDLGEPEVHPADIVHTAGSGDELHNVYGHQWAQLLFKNHEARYPNKRPFIMMRSGFAGSQRYGMIPWTGDVSRSWGGLQSQPELSLQMGLLGMAYTHSDLGGFAGGESFDKELYIRWLQYGVFQPVYRPHGQEDIAPEPVFHDSGTRDIIRDYIKLRYRMLPYNYTLAYQNALSGLPLMRPLFFEDEANLDSIEYKNAYLWGNAFLVAPVVKPGLKTIPVQLPKGVWFDYWNDKKYQGGQEVNIPVTLKTIPVLVRAGSFVPMVDDINTTKDYSSAHLNVHYYADASINNSQGTMYEDDGKTHRSLEKDLFELLRFTASRDKQNIDFRFSRQGSYPGMPTQREITLHIHNWQNAPTQLKLNHQPLPQVNSIQTFKREKTASFYHREKRQLLIKFTRSTTADQLSIEGASK